jgi:hypothetical protein
MLEARLATFEQGKKIDEEKRFLAEKALALEQYRQEVFFRAKDPQAQKRVDRLRRRWLTLNSAIIRTAKTEQESALKELAQLENQRNELTMLLSKFTQTETELAEQATLIDEREAVLKVRLLEEEPHLRIADGAEPEESAIDIDQAA